MVSFPDQTSFDPRYQILETIGSGGMGVVYKALDRVEDRFVALKTIHNPEDAVDPVPGGTTSESRALDLRRFHREIQALSLLDHEGIVRLHDVGHHNGRTYFTMELLRGLPLEAFIPRQPLDGARIDWLLRVALRVLEALGFIHRAGFIHRDLKPSNVMVVCRGERGDAPPSVEALLSNPDPRIKLLDFGLAKLVDFAAGAGRPVPGTPLYMAPESLDASEPADPRSDFYSLGVILYAAITGQLPHLTLASAVSGRTVAAPHALNPACPPVLSAAILRLLAPQPHRRFGSSEEIGRVLRSCVEGREVREEATPPRLLSPAFVGRGTTIEALRRTLAESRSGRGSVTLVSGGRGAGKSWLLDRSNLKSLAVLEGDAAYLQGRYGTEGSRRRGIRDVALGILIEMASDPGPRRLAELLGPWGGRLLDVLEIENADPGLRALWPDVGNADSGEFARDGILHSGVALLRSAAHRPRLILLDDLHAADDFDIELLARIARVIESLPLAIVATYRPEALDSHPALRRWIAEIEKGAARPWIRFQHLDPFGDGEALQMVRSILHPPGEVEPALAAELLERSGGNPRTLEAELRGLWTAGGVELESGIWRRNAKGAEDRLIADPGAISGLDEGDLEILHAGAILGERFDVDLLLSLLEGPAGGVVVARLHALAAAGVLAEVTGGFSFARQGLRETIENRIPVDRRRKLNLRCAQVLSTLGGEASADHWEAVAAHFAASGDSARAVDFYLKAARRAAARYANRRGIASFRAALGLAGPDDRAAIAFELGRLHSRIGENAEALEFFEMARGLSRFESPAILDEIGRVHHRRGEREKARRSFQRALELSGGDAAQKALALYRLGAVCFDAGDVAAAAEHFQASLAATGEADADGMASAFTGLGLVEKRRDDLEAAMRYFREAIAWAGRAANRARAAGALNNLGTIHRIRGEDREAIDCFRRSIAAREEIGDRLGLAICLNNLSRLLARRGDLTAAADSARRALRIFDEVGDQKGVLIARGNLGTFHLMRGEYEAARASFQETCSLARNTGDRRALADALHCLGRLEATRGETTAADAFLREAWRAAVDEEDRELRAGVLAARAGARLALGDREGAEDAVSEGLEEASAGGMAEARAALLTVASHSELVRGEPKRAMEKAAEALRIVERTGTRFETALVHRQLGRAYGAMGPDWVDKAEKHLAAALRIQEELGARVEAAITLMELGDLWILLDEGGEALRRYRQAEEALAGADAPGPSSLLRGRLLQLGEARQ